MSKDESLTKTERAIVSAVESMSAVTAGLTPERNALTDLYFNMLFSTAAIDEDYDE